MTGNLQEEGTLVKSTYVISYPNADFSLVVIEVTSWIGSRKPFLKKHE